MELSTVAGCVILDSEAKVLLIHRNSTRRTQWELPGGTVEKGEEPDAAVRREIEEELGVMVVIVRELGSADFAEEGKTRRFVWFLGEVFDGVPALMEEDYDDLRFFSWTELAAMKSELSANVLNMLTAYEKGELDLQ